MKEEMEENEKKIQVSEDKKEVGEDKTEVEEDKTEVVNKKTPEELPVLGRFTKRQVQEVYDLLEEGKNLEEISSFFQEKYKCRPLEKQRLQKHALKYYKLKRETESDKGGNYGDNKTRDPEPSSAVSEITNEKGEITNEDIQEMKEKMLSAPESPKKEKTGTGSSDTLLFGLDMKWVIIAAVVIIIIVVILLLRRKEEKKEPEPVPEPKPEKPKEPQIKWV